VGSLLDREPNKKSSMEAYRKGNNGDLLNRSTNPNGKILVNRGRGSWETCSRTRAAAKRKRKKKAAQIGVQAFPRAEPKPPFKWRERENGGRGRRRRKLQKKGLLTLRVLSKYAERPGVTTERRRTRGKKKSKSMLQEEKTVTNLEKSRSGQTIFPRRTGGNKL